MKHLETTFDEYIKELDRFNLHTNYYAKFSRNINKIKHVIFSGQPGCGRYSQVLKFLRRYSPSNLKYEKKCIVTYSKTKEFKIKMSDIHYEVDFQLLGCNSVTLWNAVYEQIRDIIQTKKRKVGFIVCKNFHMINEELEKVFYNYMSTLDTRNTIKFVLITSNISSIANNILNTCDVIHIKRPTRVRYNKMLGFTLDSKVPLHSIKNIKNMKLQNFNTIHVNRSICSKIVESIVCVDTLDLYELRENIYGILVFNLDVYECLLTIYEEIQELYSLNSHDILNINIKLYETLLYYNNNYRPIYHLEKFLLYLCSVINGF